ncbi:hypothetical protein Back11_07310 [Paenibacillus baekrokdamisoli]|uniref:NB-ARC domain-containing protein n=1 Tax=Paenibacillus baekrokdamisoli TaxID=1712516 RepID=A0A3G9IM44_9BACL|nr:FxSxx-COOH system tetratricopeptide repeat protein [Paenibacillus baekrokdamisoli]MBB3067428.1 tetratricopeptide (TPR) repeat protein [Paenibacillus baekrokdamisoli]BBH19386.1 hypothetical protein Back11_07310 [Paenibacillus baekrokdamisoli]
MKETNHDSVLSNPFSTGNGGVKFENLVGTTYLVALLNESIPRGLELGVTTEVSFQQRFSGATVDDIIVSSEDKGVIRKLFLQVKHNLIFSDAPSNTIFESVIKDAWHTFVNRFGNIFNIQFDKIGIVIGVYNANLDKDLQVILQWARSANNAGEYCTKVEKAKFSSNSKRKYLQIFRSQLTKAKGSIVTDEELWSFMKTLVVIHFDFDNTASSEKTNTLNSLLNLLVQRDIRVAHNLFDILRTAVEEKSSVAGTINRSQLVELLQNRGISIKNISSSKNYEQIFSMPKQNVYFTGRDKFFTKLVDSLQTMNAITLTQVIVGLGGVGKTQLAMEYAYRYKDQYDVIWWLNSEDDNTLFSDYIRFAKQINKFPDLEVTNEQLKDIAFEWLSSHKGWLLIFDNLNEWSEVETYLPKNILGHVLVTSRNQHLDRFSRTIPLDCFSPEESVTYLMTRTQLKRSKEVEELAAVLGNLPLALAHAAAYIKQKGKSFSSYLKMFKVHKLKLLDQSPELPDYDATVATTWNLSFSEVRDQSEVAVKLLYWISFTAPELIPRSLFEQNEIWSFDEFEVDNAISILLNYSLIDVDNEEQTLSIHRLVQEVIKYSMFSDLRGNYIIELATTIKDKFDYNTNDPKSWIYYEKWLPHILALITQAIEEKVLEQIVFFLVQKAGIFLLEHGRHLQGKELFENIIRWIEQMEEKREFVVTYRIAGLFTTFGTYLRDAGDYINSQKYIERGIQLNNEKESAGYEEIVAARVSLAETLMKRGCFSDALELLFYSLNLLNESDPLSSLKPSVLNLIAVSYRDKGILEMNSEDIDKAISYFDEALSILNEADNALNLEVAYILNNYGYLCIRLGCFEQAYEKCNRALQIEKQLIREDIPRLARIYNNLGMACRGLKQYEPSKKYFDLSIKYFSDSYGEGDYNVGLVLNSIGKLNWVTGDWAEAQTKLNEALLIFRRVLGDNHPNTQSTQRYLLAVQEKTTFQEYEDSRKNMN